MSESSISLTASFPPEFRLLIACGRVDPDASRQRAALVQQPLDWQRTLALARHHGVTPLLHRHLAHEREVPEAVRAELARYARDNTAHTLGLTHALLTLLGALRAQGVSAIPYKGPLLAVCAYGEVSLRASKDLDVLVRPEDFARARGVLEALGYTAGVRGPYHVGFVQTRTGTEVELHHDVLRRKTFPTPLDLGAMWARRGRVSLLGAEVECFTPEDTLLLLCLHGSKHLWAGLTWLCDVAAFIRAHPALDWAHLLDTAAAARLSRPVLLGLVLARELLGAPLPDSVQRRAAAEPGLAALARGVALRLGNEQLGHVQLGHAQLDHIQHPALERRLSLLWMQLELHFGSARLPLAHRLMTRLLKPQAGDYRRGGWLGAHFVRVQRLVRRGVELVLNG